MAYFEPWQAALKLATSSLASPAAYNPSKKPAEAPLITPWDKLEELSIGPILEVLDIIVDTYNKMQILTPLWQLARLQDISRCQWDQKLKGGTTDSRHPTQLPSRMSLAAQDAPAVVVQLPDSSTFLSLAAERLPAGPLQIVESNSPRNGPGLAQSRWGTLKMPNYQARCLLWRCKAQAYTPLVAHDQAVSWANFGPSVATKIRSTLHKSGMINLHIAHWTEYIALLLS